MMRSVEKNENSNILIVNKSPILKPLVKPTKTTPTATPEIVPEEIIVKPVPNKKNLAFYDSINRFFKDFKTKSTDNFSENDIQSLESKIEIAKKQLAVNTIFFNIVLYLLNMVI